MSIETEGHRPDRYSRTVYPSRLRVRSTSSSFVLHAHHHSAYRLFLGSVWRTSYPYEHIYDVALLSRMSLNFKWFRKSLIGTRASFAREAPD